MSLFLPVKYTREIHERTKGKNIVRFWLTNDYIKHIDYNQHCTINSIIL